MPICLSQPLAAQLHSKLWGVNGPVGVHGGEGESAVKVEETLVDAVAHAVSAASSLKIGVVTGGQLKVERGKWMETEGERARSHGQPANKGAELRTVYLAPDGCSSLRITSTDSTCHETGSGGCTADITSAIRARCPSEMVRRGRPSVM